MSLKSYSFGFFAFAFKSKSNNQWHHFCDAIKYFFFLPTKIWIGLIRYGLDWIRFLIGMNRFCSSKAIEHLKISKLLLREGGRRYHCSWPEHSLKRKSSYTFECLGYQREVLSYQLLFFLSFENSRKKWRLKLQVSQRKVSRWNSDEDRVLLLKSDRKRTWIVMLCTLENMAPYSKTLNLLYFNEYNFVI